MRRFEIESEGRERGEGERIIRRGENKEKRRARRKEGDRRKSNRRRG